MIYKYLCTDGLGINARQNELIEMALTYGFKGIEIDMADMLGRAEAMGKEFATQFINSAAVEVTSFRLPIDLRKDDAGFEAEMAKLESICELATIVKAKQCFISIAASHPELNYMENFEKHSARIRQIAERLAQCDLRLGLQFNACKGPEGEKQFVHKAEEIVAVIKSVSRDNVGLVLDTWHWQLGGGTLDAIKALDLNTVFEVRLADFSEGATPADAKRSKRLEPGTNPDSISQATLDWLKEQDYQGPVGLTAHVPKSPANAGDLPFQRIAKVLDQMIEGTHGMEEETEPETESEDSAVEVGSSN